MRVKAWVHPRGVVRVSIMEGMWGKDVALDDVSPHVVAEWLSGAEMDERTRDVLVKYLWGWM